MNRKGFSPHRFEDNPLEKRYADEWIERNRYSHTLEYILSPTNQLRDSTMTKRDQEVANTVIQWLGSIVGQGFVRSVLTNPDRGE